MFNKEKSNEIKSITNIDFKSLKKVGAIIIATVMLSPTISSASEYQTVGTHDLEKQQYEYMQKVSELKKSSDFDIDLSHIYNYYNFIIDGKKINVSKVYLHYGYDDNNNFVMYITVPKFGDKDIINNQEYHLHNNRLIQLRQLTLFIDLLRTECIEIDEENQTLIFTNKKDEINQLINNWDGKIHDLVPETAAYDSFVVIEEKEGKKYE